MLETAAAALLIVVPIAFNVAFFALGRAFDYPDILRRPPDEILRRFHAGGAGLVLRWEALLSARWRCSRWRPSSPSCLGGAGRARPRSRSSFGVAAALVQAPRTRRWPFAVPELARRYVAADGPDGRRRRPPPSVGRSRRCSPPSTGCSASGSASTSATCSRALDARARPSRS